MAEEISVQAARDAKGLSTSRRSQQAVVYLKQKGLVKTSKRRADGQTRLKWKRQELFEAWRYTNSGGPTFIAEK
jgi:hypothetical protein